MYKKFLIFLILIYSTIVQAQDHNTTQTNIDLSGNNWSLSKTEKLVWTNVTIGGVILIWGFTQWDYGSEDFHFDDEGWFSKETSNGGADKLGHFYTNYLMTRIMAPIYYDWGYSRNDAAFYASLTSAMSGLLIEIGDGFSGHGFSHEDLIMDLLGSATGYLWYANPSLAEKIDFRVEHIPDFSKEDSVDITTDYENMKHLMAVKAEGFDMFKNSYMEYLELHVGYYTRNFHHNSTPIEDRERYIYATIGINLSKLTRKYIGNYSAIFNYYQVPYTYVPVSHEFD